MGLIQNGFRESTGKFIGASLLNAANPYVSIPWAQITNRKRNSLLSYPTQAAIPSGYLNPGAWVMPNKPGGMSSRNEAIITISGNSSNAAQGINLSGSATIELSTSGGAAAIAAAIGSATITFTTSGNAVAPLNAIGSATITFTANGDISAPASLSGTTSITFSNAATLTAIGHMVAIPIDTALTPDAIASAVWSAIASANNNAGTMGEKLNDAGSASNPWTETIEGTYTAAEIMRIVLSVLAGKTNIDGTTVTFRDINDTKDRVTAEMTGSERTSITLDGSE